jgi:4-amino-4-deoxy-L-arabinose transferase-like glycosyltransferase
MGASAAKRRCGAGGLAASSIGSADRSRAAESPALPELLVLLTTYGFVAPHVARTGDYDALLVFFAAALVTTSYHILEDLRRERSPSNGLIVCASLALLGAIMTKGVAGLMILPGIAAGELTSGAIFNSLRDRRLCVALLLHSPLPRLLCRPGILLLWLFRSRMGQ